jgi:hypothetical protein
MITKRKAFQVFRIEAVIIKWMRIAECKENTFQIDFYQPMSFNQIAHLSK